MNVYCDEEVDQVLNIISQVKKMTPNQLQQLFYREIPLTQHMGLQVITSTSENIVIQFQLAENKNHKGTAFGGSQYTPCALALIIL